MCNMRHCYFPVIILLLLLCVPAKAQLTASNPADTSKKNYNSFDQMQQNLLLIELPPLDSLFESARLNNAVMLMQEKEIEAALRDVKTENNGWWSFIRPFGTYQYGLMASLVEITSGGIPVNPNYSQTAQSWWNVGISLSVPLNEYIDRPNKIKKEKARVDAQLYNLDVKFDELKIKIAQAYSECILSLTLSKALTEKYNFAKMQYKILEKDFLEGRVTSVELSNAKTLEVNAYVELQERLSDLIYYASSLETLSKVKIIKY